MVLESMSINVNNQEASLTKSSISTLTLQQKYRFCCYFVFVPKSKNTPVIYMSNKENRLIQMQLKHHNLIMLLEINAKKVWEHKSKAVDSDGWAKRPFEALRRRP